MNAETKTVLEDYLTRAFREGGVGAIDCCIHAIEKTSEAGVKTMKTEDVLDFLHGMKKMIAERKGMPLGAINHTS